jgi:ABC-type bacteriocin transporter
MKKYKTIKQNDMKDCGAACIATVLHRYGSHVPISKIREYAGTDMNGTNVLGLIKTLERFDFATKAIKADMGIFNDTSLPYPAIAHVVIDNAMLHYIVIQKVAKKHVIISDPGVGTKKISKQAFEKIWTGVLLFCIPTTEYVKVDEQENALGKIFKVFMKDYKLILHTITAAFFVILISIVASFYFQTLVDTIIPQGSHFNLHIISFGLIIIYVFKSVFEFLKNYLLTILGNRISVRVMLGYFSHVLKLPMNFFATRKSGEIISRFMDASKVVNALATATLTMVLDVTMVLIVGIIMIIQNPTMFFIMLGVLPVYTLIILSFVKLYEKANHKEMETSALLNSYVIETLNGIETVKAMNAENTVSKKMDGLFMNYIDAAFKSFNITNTQSFFKQLLQLINNALILWIGAGIVMNGHLSVGQLITFSTLVSYFSSSLQNIINLQPELQTGKVAAQRLDDVFVIEGEGMKSANKNISHTINFNDKIEIRDLSFSYPMKRTCLSDINLTIKHGEKVAFIGESGTGKSTLAKLLVDFYEPVAGTVAYDGYYVKDLDNELLRKNVTLVPQSSFFFTGSVYENLVFGIEGHVDFKAVEDACKIANIFDFIEAQPLKFHTLIEENGSNLSGGQKQRLAIARAILRKPKVMILDEATSNIDTISERKVMEALYEIEDLTIIFISHNLSVLRKCHTLFVFENGKIVETGTHQTLRDAKGTYDEMLKSGSDE